MSSLSDQKVLLVGASRLTRLRLPTLQLLTLRLLHIAIAHVAIAHALQLTTLRLTTLRLTTRYKWPHCDSVVPLRHWGSSSMEERQTTVK